MFLLGNIFDQSCPNVQVVFSCRLIKLMTANLNQTLTAILSQYIDNNLRSILYSELVPVLVEFLTYLLVRQLFSLISVNWRVPSFLMLVPRCAPVGLLKLHWLDIKLFSPVLSHVLLYPFPSNMTRCLPLVRRVPVYLLCNFLLRIIGWETKDFTSHFTDYFAGIPFWRHVPVRITHAGLGLRVSISG